MIFAKNLLVLQIHVKMVERVVLTDTIRPRIRITAHVLSVSADRIAKAQNVTKIHVYTGEKYNQKKTVHVGDMVILVTSPIIQL